MCIPPKTIFSFGAFLWALAMLILVVVASNLLRYFFESEILLMQLQSLSTEYKTTE